MRNHSCLAVILAALLFSSATMAADHYQASFTNDTPYELIQITMYLETRGEIRRSASRVVLEPGETYRLGVSGAIRPLRIAVDVADARIEFDDLSELSLSPSMNLTVSSQDGRVLLVQTEADGTERRAPANVTRYLTPANTESAVDKDDIVEAKTADEVRRIVTEFVRDAHETSGEPVAFDVEAGPIWNNGHAATRCPEVTEEWKKENGDDGNPRWTGHWMTTVPGEMSVCGLLRGPATLEETLFEGENGVLVFPVEWYATPALGKSIPLHQGSPEVAISISLKVGEETMDDVAGDLMYDYRPWRMRVEYRRSGKDDVEVVYPKRDLDETEAWEDVTEHFAEGRKDGDLGEMTVLLVDEDAYEKAASGEEAGSAPGVVLLCSKGTIEAVFLPDVSDMLDLD